jgi:hypothetical protein
LISSQYPNQKILEIKQMANIKVNDLMNLNLAGTDLFEDPETFLTELSEENDEVFGGLKPVDCLAPTCERSRIICPRSDRTIVYAV